MKDLLRTCDRGSNACCMFFTLGGKQVGRAAIAGWEEMLIPHQEDLAIWPFDGNIGHLLEDSRPVVVEIYPAEASRHIGAEVIGKPKPEVRKRVADRLLAAAPENCRFSEQAETQIRWGFENDDAFDAMVGLLSMLHVLTGKRSEGVPEDEHVRKVEGWIFGMRSD